MLTPTHTFGSAFFLPTMVHFFPLLIVVKTRGPTLCQGLQVCLTNSTGDGISPSYFFPRFWVYGFLLFNTHLSWIEKHLKSVLILDLNRSWFSDETL